MYFASVGLAGTQTSSESSLFGFRLGRNQASRRDAQEVRRRQLNHLQLATGVLAKYNALHGDAPTPQQYADMLSELLEHIEVQDPSSANGSDVRPQGPQSGGRKTDDVSPSRGIFDKPASLNLETEMRPICPRLERVASTTSRVLSSVGLQGFRGLLRDVYVQP